MVAPSRPDTPGLPIDRPSGSEEHFGTLRPKPVPVNLLEAQISTVMKHVLFEIVRDCPLCHSVMLAA
jgi:hypothetical protein